MVLKMKVFRWYMAQILSLKSLLTFISTLDWILDGTPTCVDAEFIHEPEILKLPWSTLQGFVY